MANENNNPNPIRSHSQKERILAYLQDGGCLTPLDALKKVGTMKLATRISELINEDDWGLVNSGSIRTSTRTSSS